jgi:hypothetical protein
METKNQPGTVSKVWQDSRVGRQSMRRGVLQTSIVVAALVVDGCACGDESGGRTSQGDGPVLGTESSADTTDDDGGHEGDGPKLDVAPPDDIPPPCVNLQCQQVVCNDPEVTTTVSGTVYDPSGTLPLYNVVVYVPNAEVEPLEDGLVCDQCDASPSGSPLVSDLTDTQGRFVLENVPVGTDIPLVIQIGKWRRQITLPEVQACEDNPLNDPEMTRLPRSRAEGDLPKIALTTGNADPLVCLLRRLGIADSEYGIMGTDARVHLTHGARDGAPGNDRFDDGFGNPPGAMFPGARTTLWESGWQDYDIVLLSCEGTTGADHNDGLRQNMHDYINAGGRVFATHLHYTWIDGVDREDEAVQQELAAFHSTAEFGGNDDPNNYYGNGAILDINTSFPKGEALADWLEFVEPNKQSPWGQFEAFQTRFRAHALNEALTQLWVSHDRGDYELPIYFAFNAPLEAPPEDQCGRMVYTGMHVSQGAGSASAPFPSACNDDAPLTKQEKALIFLLFDLFACITPDETPPQPPPPG